MPSPRPADPVRHQPDAALERRPLRRRRRRLPPAPWPWLFVGGFDLPRAWIKSLAIRERDPGLTHCDREVTLRFVCPAAYVERAPEVFTA